MSDERIGLRVELLEDMSQTPKGTRGVIAEKGGYIGVVFDDRSRWGTKIWGLTIAHAGRSIMDYVKIVEDEREPVAEQMRLF